MAIATSKSDFLHVLNMRAHSSVKCHEQDIRVMPIILPQFNEFASK